MILPAILDGETLLPFDAAQVVAGIEAQGAVSIPIIPRPLRLRMLEEARGLPFVKGKRYVGKDGRVEQNLWVATHFLPSGVLIGFRDLFTAHLTTRFAALQRSLFEGSLHFNEMVSQRYQPNPVGISAHQDYSVDRNLICVAMLGGHGQFCLCDSRAGDNLRPLDSRPGNVILMRAPGFLGGDVRPWHCAKNVTSERFVLTMRQVVPRG